MGIFVGSVPAIKEFMKIRVTQLEMYERCPYCFYLRRVVGIKQKPSKAMGFGTGVHKMLENYHLGKKNDVGWYEQAILDDYKKYYPKPKDFEFVEKKFSVEVTHPTTNESLGLTMTGHIDLIRHSWIIDHKTSSGKYKQETVDDHFQLIAYSYAYWKLSGKLPAGMRINAIIKNKVPYIQIVDSYVDLADLTSWYNRVKMIYEGIKNKDFEPKRSWWHYYDSCISQSKNIDKGVTVR